MPSYRFRPKAELIWFVLIAVITTLMQALIEFDAALIADWQAWAIALGSALVRAAAGAFLAYVAKEGWFYGNEEEQADKPTP